MKENVKVNIETEGEIINILVEVEGLPIPLKHNFTSGEREVDLKPPYVTICVKTHGIVGAKLKKIDFEINGLTWFVLEEEITLKEEKIGYLDNVNFNHFNLKY